MASTTIPEADVEPQFDAYIVFSKNRCEDPYYADYTRVIGLYQTRQGAIDKVNQWVAAQKAKFAETQCTYDLSYHYFVTGFHFRDRGDLDARRDGVKVYEAIGDTWESFEQRTGRGDY